MYGMNEVYTAINLYLYTWKFIVVYKKDASSLWKWVIHTTEWTNYISIWWQTILPLHTIEVHILRLSTLHEFILKSIVTKLEEVENKCKQFWVDYTYTISKLTNERL